MSIKSKLATVGVAVLGAFSVSQVQAVPVGLELALLVDVSGSVSGTEYALQKTGYVNAFNSASVQAAIAGITGGIAVTYIEWSGAADQSVQVNWTLLTDGASASAFAAAINGTTRASSANTAPGSAINFATPLFGTETGGGANGFESLRQVIDVSGDGAQNEGASTITARNNALAAGIDTINGLAILGETGLATWYQNNIVGGTGGTLYTAANFADFERAVLVKIGTEITGGAPEPGSLALVSLAALGLFGVARRRRLS